MYVLMCERDPICSTIKRFQWAVPCFTNNCKHVGDDLDCQWDTTGGPVYFSVNQVQPTIYIGQCMVIFMKHSQ